ncbi:melanocortin-2 receptor accessory protein 2A [Sphaeramia orbicularis]|uniref:Melanocortin-2 receptor accessory protein 2A-like n=1 Tax=Sphaeramia orbicularis TaxID=375764 RepID=A0A673BSY8_9TELE|nr:melanocortin-2 receptor accessory protein 2A-like [Sphaeramia orbicularis]
MSASEGSNATGASAVPDYEWRYEYYDDEEPVLYEGLRAHRYSIVIGFWVGLAVFVIFMFFLLTLLTKTGAPHPDSGQQCEKRARLIGYLDTNLSNEAPPPHPHGVDTSRCVFQCYTSNKDPRSSRALWTTDGGGSGPGGSHSSGLEVGGGVLLQEVAVTDNRTEKDAAVLLAHFNIPNFVSSEQSSTVGDDDLLLGETELPIILEGRDQSNRSNDHLSD